MSNASTDNTDSPDKTAKPASSPPRSAPDQLLADLDIERSAPSEEANDKVIGGQKKEKEINF